MEFGISEEGKIIEDQVVRFLNEKIIPAEKTIGIESQEISNGVDTPTMKALRAEAKSLGLWNLYLSDKEWGAGVSNHDYSVLCEHMGRSPVAPRVFNCNAPDTGNAEIVAEFGTDEQKDQWLKPLLEGEIRSCFSMTKVVVPNMMMNVLDRVIQCLGALGVSDDTPVAGMWRNGRALRIADGPDEVHKMVIARRELKRFA